MLDALKKSIGIKLTLWLSVSLVVILTIITFMNVSSQNSNLFKREEDAAKKLSDAVLTAMRYPMLTGDQEIVQTQFDQYNTDLKGIIEMQLINDKGEVKRVTRKDQANLKMEEVLSYDKRPLQNLQFAMKGKSNIYEGLEPRRGSMNKQVFTVLRPIENEQKCFGCHGKNKEVLGVLRIVLDWSDVEKAMADTQNKNILFSLIGLIAMGVLVFLLLKRMLSLPVGTLIKGSVPLSNGDLTQKISIASKDELGRLGDAFNKIISSMHQIVSQVRSSADKVASSAEEMSSSAQEMNATTQEVSTAIQKVSKGAGTQAEKVEETFETMEKTSTSIKQMVANAQSASQAVAHTSTRAEAGRATAQEAVDRIERLTGTVVDTSKVIQNLGQMSQQIGEITETITSIADQTNLLALNAAIEAARAGEAGRGFAVVAEEVRKLAEGSAEAVRKIGGLIRSIQNETNRAVTAIETSSKEVQEGKIQVSKISDVLTEINKAAQEAAAVTDEIARAGQERVVEVDRVVKSINEVAAIAKESASTVQEVSSSTEEQTASMEEMSASAQELARLAMDLKEVVGKFKLEEKELSGKQKKEGRYE
ncbi:MAG: methyl-accepting chemotaxis protein [Deltaproteobacteria bacterium]